MVCKSWFCAVLLPVLTASVALPALAQVHVEIQPFVGYKFGGKLHPGGDDPTLPSANIQTSRVQGATVTVTGVEAVKWMWGAEFMWNNQPTHVTIANWPPNSNILSLRINQFLLHGLIGRSDERARQKLLPFALFGAGVTQMSGFTAFNNRYAFSFGGGIRYFFTKRVGLRLQGRFTPVHMFDSTQTYTVVYEPGTPSGTTRQLPKYFNQGEFTAGCIFRLF
jgi:hypothetical protein